MLIADATLPDGRTCDVRIEGERIAAVAESAESGDGGLDAAEDETVVDAAGLRLFPGAIDVHVHFREPGAGHKETWTTGSRSAAAGGVTTVVDQPNTDPPTVTGEALEAKRELAAEQSLVDFGINGGVTADWDPDSLFTADPFALGEVFLADSTGEMGIEGDLFADAVERAAVADTTVTVHAEDATLFDGDALEDAGDGVGRDADADAWSAFRTADAEAAAVERALAVAGDFDAAVHIAHTSTPEGIDLAAEAGATCEVTPHHLYLSRDDLDELGTFGRMNPPLRSAERREAVFERVVDGTVDMIATDHAPHTREEKEATIAEAPSGVPGVETMLPLLLATAAADDRLSYERVRDLTAANPADVFGLDRKGRIEAGRDADLVLVDPDATRPISGEDLHSNCEWTPFEGMDGVFPLATLRRGEVVYADPAAATGAAAVEGIDAIAPAADEFGSPNGDDVRLG
ncbi:dihydroorotase [Salinarchaeum sp. Harcht-Bsk1]|uniref:dihydroorotase n=1 Tax=Salinarchaeum sp. Harcht-Bsk1 TaxID=1333523 RepID=UPI0003422D07|nr:dihydroorotase [Salinarchaeum sp. Harcht-Bsk1]AGN00491.1 dihydroorotase [Salinarchaeum sp. Harcht-Bsk1]